MGRPLVLVVDDDAAIRQFICRILDLYGYETCEATSGDEAVRAVHTLRPAVILLDLCLPGLHGNDVIEHLQDDPTPIVVLSGQIGQLREDLKPQLAGCLSKPVGARDLVREVEAALAAAATGHAAADTVVEPVRAGPPAAPV